MHEPREASGLPGGHRFWQIGVIVRDFDAALRELRRTLGLSFSEIKEFERPEGRQRIAFSEQGPPYFELIEGLAGTSWDATNGSRLDHLAYWTPDLPSQRIRLEVQGAPVVMDGQARGKLVNYHLLPAAGFRIELFDDSRRAEIRRDWNVEDVL